MERKGGVVVTRSRREQGTEGDQPIGIKGQLSKRRYQLHNAVPTVNNVLHTYIFVKKADFMLSVLITIK